MMHEHPVLVSACLLGVACRYDGKSVPCTALLEQLKNLQCIPVCPEQLGGLPTPRVPCERQGNRVISKTGVDTTAQYERGAQQALKLATLFGCKAALLKERSPSCGCGQIYDGSFSKKLIDGDGVTAALLRQHGIAVFGESRLHEFLKMQPWSQSDPCTK